MSPHSTTTPYWVSELQSPPQAKSKVPGVQDPPGFGSGSFVSKVRCAAVAIPEALLTITLIEIQRRQSRASQTPD